MSNAVVFVGPSLSVAEARNVLDANYRPPAGCGDVYAAVREGTRAIGVVDGYFCGRRSVWHKEILWALHEGITVFGASSMGALRAAELSVFGMRGVGRIYRQFMDGTLTDDDEVAQVHAPSELGFVSISTPLVDIRETLSRALAAGVIDDALHGKVVAAAKRLFYPDRTYPRVLASAALDEGERMRLSRWIDCNAVSLKRLDALAMLAVIREREGVGCVRDEPSFVFEQTEEWLCFERANGSGTPSRTPDRGIGGVNDSYSLDSCESLARSRPVARSAPPAARTERGTEGL